MSDDLANYATRKKSEEGVSVTLRNPNNLVPLVGDVDGKKQEMTIKTLGRDGDDFKARGQRVAQETMGNDNKGEVMRIHAASVTVGGEIVYKGKWITLNEENSLAIYEECPWMVEQVDVNALDLANFFPDASKP